ncbi:MAG: PAS domain-containing protein [Rhodobacteraceae bacterium]|nr:PAS domain-containing protein [Paracoccaceae bacterium]
MQDPVLLDLLTYWERLRADRVAPLRSELDPREIRGALDHTFILEHTGPDDVRFRLAGSSVCDRMGMELRGMPARSVIDPDSRAKFDAILTDLLADPKIVELHSQPNSADHSVGTARMLLLPMQSEAGSINRILGCISQAGLAQSPPRRFVITKQKTTRIVSSQTPRPTVFARGFAESEPEYSAGSPAPKSPEPPVFQSFEGGKRPDSVRGRITRPNLQIVKDE